MVELRALFARIKSPPMQPRAHALALLAAATCLLPLLLQLPPQLGIGFGIAAVLIAIASWRTQKSASRSRSALPKIVAVGFSGLLNSTTFVFGEKALASSSSVRPKCGGVSVTNFGMPPARRTNGA